MFWFLNFPKWEKFAPFTRNLKKTPNIKFGALLDFVREEYFTPVCEGYRVFLPAVFLLSMVPWEELELLLPSFSFFPP